jgi:hypothetical protein
MDTQQQFIQYIDALLPPELAKIAMQYFPRQRLDSTYSPQILCFLYMFVPFFFASLNECGWNPSGPVTSPMVFPEISRPRTLSMVRHIIESHPKIMAKKWKQALRKWTEIPTPFAHETFEGDHKPIGYTIGYTLLKFTYDCLANQLPIMPDHDLFHPHRNWPRGDVQLCLSLCLRYNLPLIRIYTVHRAVRHLLSWITKKKSVKHHYNLVHATGDIYHSKKIRIFDMQ